MKKLYLLAIAIATLMQSAICATTTLPEGYPQTERTKISINDGWKFHLGDADDKNYLTSLDDSSWESVTIPHTLKLTSIILDGVLDDKYQKTFHREVGWYRRSITPSKSTKRVVLYFEGVHQVTTLWVNGKEVGVHKVGGYTPFEYDITDYVKRGVANQITVLADNRVSQTAAPDPGMFDYVKFSGLYRDVYLIETSQMHITSNLESMDSGVTITTPSVDYVNGNATIDIRTEIRNESKSSQTATVIQRVVDATGKVVLKMEKSATIEPGTSHRFVQTGGVEDDVKFWSPDYPYLYKVNTLLVDGAGNTIDVVDNRLGLRKVEYDYERGFVINGKVTELIGFNRHQHISYLGDAMPNSLHYRDMIQFKELGLNCMRTAHYPHDDEIIKACDELGILVYEEAPTWIGISTETEWYENMLQAARVMIRNHKNSPSVIIWGAGINHRGPVPEVQFTVKQEDPTRLTASQSSRWTGWQTSGWTDIYANMTYGPGIWDRSEPMFAMESRVGPLKTAEYIRDPKMPGIISWTAHAYYTFHSFDDPEDRTRSGAMDCFRYPKNPDLLWYQSELLSAPYISVINDWEADLPLLTIFSNATELELFQNGESMGRFTPSRNFVYDGLTAPPYLIENLPYLSNELIIKGYRQGVEIFEKSLFTPEKATKLRLYADQLGVDFTADGNDILVVHAEVVDNNGTKINDYKGKIKFTVSGDASVIGDEVDINANPVSTKLGKGSALIRAGKSVGKVKITASCDGLSSDSIEVETVEPETNMVLANAYQINDRETMLVDLGGEGQLIQFGWTEWTTLDQEQSSITLLQNKLGDLVAGDTPADIDAAAIVDAGTPGAYTFKVATASGEGVLRWLGEMNVIGRDGFVYGDGVLSIDNDGLDLTIEGLALGSYTLKAYHHAPSSNTNSMDPNLERLKSESIHKLPYSSKLNVEVNGKRALKNVAVTSGKERQYEAAGTSTINFVIGGDDNGEIEINYKSNDNNPGVWLNGFELVREL
ncbi:MAG: glycoside hydrolase family 2 TIM barrel-domain containing protein [Rikenellaceae bacterium]